MKRFQTTPALLATFALAACAGGGETTTAGAPQPVEYSAAALGIPGSYQLAQVDGQDLPVYTGSYENCREYVIRGTLTLGTDGRYQMTPTMREVCEERTEVEREGEGEIGTYSVDGNTVRFNEEAIEREEMNRWENTPSGGPEIPIEDLGGTGTFQGNTLEVQLVNDQSTATFRK